MKIIVIFSVTFLLIFSSFVTLADAANPKINAKTIPIPPVIDGVVYPEEYGNPTSHPQLYITIENYTFRTVVDFVHDDQFLYGRVSVNLPENYQGTNPSVILAFDNENDGSVFDVGDDRIGFREYEPRYFDGVQPPPESRSLSDLTYGGTNDVEAVYLKPDEGFAGMDQWISIEFKKQLCSTDSQHDFCAKIGDTLGLLFELEINPPSSYVRSNNTYDLFLDKLVLETTGSPTLHNQVGQVNWSEDNYLGGSGSGLLQVIDNDVKFRSASQIDSFLIDVWSDSDKQGTKITVTETGINTGIFEGTIFFSQQDNNIPNQLYVSPGDVVTARYTDKFLPPPHLPFDSLDIQDVSKIDPKIETENLLFNPDEQPTPEGDKLKTSKIYKNLFSLESTGRISPLFKINTSLFDKEHITIPLFEDIRTFKTISIEKESQSKFIWKGHDEEHSSRATVIVNGDNVVGNIYTTEKLYSIKPLGVGNHVLVDVTADVFVDESPDWAEDQQAYSSINWHHEFEIAMLQEPSQSVQEYIDILVLYTENVDDLVLDINDEIELALEETNDSHIMSNSKARYNVVHTQEVDYDKVGILTDLNRLKNPADNHLDFVHDLRDEYGADIVLLYVDVSNSGCGMAGGIGISEYEAFAIVDYVCATGYFSFGHEIGHLHGARHIIETDSTDEPYEYGHGYCDPNPSYQWRTIMAYNCPDNTGGPRVQYWSNPNITFAGDVFGTAELQDNARVFDETFQYVCSFRDPNCTDIIFQTEIRLLEENFEFCFNDFPNNGGLSQQCIDNFDPCGCGVDAPVCQNMVCSEYQNLRELVVLRQLQEISPYELINLGVKPSMILPRDGMVMLDSDKRDKPLRVKVTSAERMIEINPSFYIRN